MNTETTVSTTKSQVEAWKPPAVDLLQGQEGWRLLVDLPGVNREGLELSAEQGVLTVVARRADRPELGFRRRVRLPEGVDVDGVQAELKHGVLAVNLPLASRHRGRTIEVA